MHLSSIGVRWASPNLAQRPRRSVWRAGLGTLVVATLLTGSSLAAPAPVEAGSSCTGWSSQVVPPRTIRVLRTTIGRVQRVPFRRYVAEVMASGEWPSRLHMVTLEAGAVATKQYAWYYAMNGHHRPYYRHDGHCYDVRDDTADQLYRPERARPSGRQTRAIDATWGLTLRKYGRFFLTGYRAGVASTCAADANGWKLYALSVEACARQGWSRQRVQRTYLGPSLSFVWSPRVGPILNEPVIYLRAGNSMPDDAVSVSWKPDVASSGVSRYTLQRKVGRGAWQPVWLAQTACPEGPCLAEDGRREPLPHPCDGSPGSHRTLGLQCRSDGRPPRTRRPSPQRHGLRGRRQAPWPDGTRPLHGSLGGPRRAYRARCRTRQGVHGGQACRCREPRARDGHQPRAGLGPESRTRPATDHRRESRRSGSADRLPRLLRPEVARGRPLGAKPRPRCTLCRSEPKPDISRRSAPCPESSVAPSSRPPGRATRSR